MSFDYINEAFRKLNMLEEDVFDTSIGGLNNLSTFLDNDDDDIVKVIDPEAETEENLSNSYVGKVIIDCNVCHSKIFSEKSDIVLSEDGVVNPEEQCPYCGETSGFTVVGEIKEFEQDTAEETPTDETPVDETPTEETETQEGEEKPEVEEALTEELSAENSQDDEPISEEFDAFTAVSTFLTGKGYDVSSKDGKAYVWGVVDYLDMGGIEPTTENLESWLADTLANEEYRSELESCCRQPDVQEDLSVDVDSLDEAYFRPVEGEEGVKRALIESCNEYTVTLLEITDEDGVWYEVGINHPTQDFEQVEIGEYKTQQFAEDIAQKVVDLLNKYVDLEELSSVYDFNTRNIYNKIASRMPETEPTTEELHEDIQNLSLTTDETQVKLTSDENGKVTLVTEPVIKEEAEPEVIDEPAADGELEIAPVSDETVDAIVDNNEVETEEDEEIPEEPVEEAGEEDVALDEVDEEGLDELGESYMKAVYENVESFKTTNVSANDTHIVVEGLIKFTSGTERKTGFIFEAHTARDNKVNFKGCNEHFSKDRNSFTLDCSVVDRKLLPESLSYNYNVDGREISGTVTRKGV